MKLMYDKSSRIQEARAEINNRPDLVLSQLTKNSSGSNMYNCPICGSGTKRHKTGALSYDPKRNRFKCFACEDNENTLGGKGQDVLGTLRILWNCSEAEVFERAGIIIDNQSSTEPTAATRNEPKQQAPTEQQPEPETDFTDFYLQANKSISKTDYLQKRGISQATADRYKLGYIADWRHPKSPKSPATPRVIIPISKYSYLARDVRAEIPSSQIDYAKSKVKGTESPLWIFNHKALESSTQPIFIVEGEFDALSFIEIGKQAISIGSTSNANKFLEYAKDRNPSQPLIIALDNDPAGKTATKALYEKLQENGVLSYRADPQDLYGDHKDANEALVSDRASFTEKVNRYLFTRVSDRVNDYINNVMFADIEKAKERNYIKTGIESYDEATGGLYPGFYIFAAGTSQGKTTLIHQIADNLAFNGNHVLYFSLEMSRLELASKSISRMAFKQDPETARTALQIRRGALTEPILKAAESYTEQVQDRLHIIEGNFETDTQFVVNYVESFIRKYDIAPIVIIDYLQILNPGDNDNARASVDMSVRSLKQLSARNNICVIALSSINRSNYSAGISFEALKESGSIEFTADVVLGMQFSIVNDDDMFEEDKGVVKKRNRLKKEKDKPVRKMDIVCLKNRYGPTDLTPEVKLTYFAAYDYLRPYEKADDLL